MLRSLEGNELQRVPRRVNSSASFEPALRRLLKLHFLREDG
jgi:hypothetical protein